MTVTTRLKAVDCLQILTLLDNTIDLTASDNNAVIQRARPLTGNALNTSILAEHGFSALISAIDGETVRSMLFDFGFSPIGAAWNADALGADLTRVEQMALSHAHPDHFGGLRALVEKTGQQSVPLVLHPAAFRHPRYTQTPEGGRLVFPSFTRQQAEAAGAAVIETDRPYPMLNRTALFLGQIPRTTGFERGSARLFCEIDGQDRPDPFDDDTAMVFLLRGKGLVILTGCAHAGIVNTVLHARQVTGIEAVHAIMGGFHLGGAKKETVVKPTVDALKAFSPSYIIPTHCSGRKTMQWIEKEMPRAFLPNMSGTRLTFSA